VGADEGPAAARAAVGRRDKDQPPRAAGERRPRRGARAHFCVGAVAVGCRPAPHETGVASVDYARSEAHSYSQGGRVDVKVKNFMSQTIMYSSIVGHGEETGRTRRLITACFPHEDDPPVHGGCTGFHTATVGARTPPPIHAGGARELTVAPLAVTHIVPRSRALVEYLGGGGQKRPDVLPNRLVRTITVSIENPFAIATRWNRSMEIDGTRCLNVN